MCENGILVIWENSPILRGYMVNEEMKYLEIFMMSVIYFTMIQTYTCSHTKQSMRMHKYDKMLTTSESRRKIYRYSWYHVVYFSIGLKFFKIKS